MRLKFTLDRFEGDTAVLIDEKGQSLVWPKNKLPQDLHDGSVLVFNILTDKDQEKKDKQTAKDLLNEIISQP